MNEPITADTAEFKPTDWQKIAAEKYEDGEHAWVLDAKTNGEFRQNLRDVGDGLFKFVMLELGPLDATSMDEAIARMDKAQRQISDLLGALENAPAADAASPTA